ncbi:MULTISPECIES: hypothetical protein [Sphingobium]|uniref:hypothetical protein n=1 Tax=Sphingobium TaxID=165695 RepID=UPI000A75D27E|nr:MULTISPECIES: hypothetical protein [Sphingobium]PJG48956.1 hypothetical protein CAF53_12475 [Sphingobium sp. LB126]
MDDADVASPLFPLLKSGVHPGHGPNHDAIAPSDFPCRMAGRAKNASDKGTIKHRICFTGVRFFRISLEFSVFIPPTLN